MKILISNKFWYRRGGDCIYAMNLKQLLEEKGHQVAVFAMDCSENVPSGYDTYYPSEVEFKMGPMMVGAAARSLGFGSVVSKFNLLLDDFKPDVVHLNNIHTQLSPVLAELAHNRGCKVVWTLHDYKLLCPRYDCRQNGNTICEECFDRKLPVLKHKCMKNSFPASVLAYVESVCWNRKRLEKCVDTFICPSEFMWQKMLQGGFKTEKLVHLCNFIDISKCKLDNYEDREDYCCYVGRLSQEKGTKTLITAANELSDRKFIIVGDGPLRGELQSIARYNIKFVGTKDWSEIKEIVSKAKFTVIPSEWYENNPLSVIESKCLGTPVLGANIGGIPELIDDKCGMTFKSADVEDLEDKIDQMFKKEFDCASIALSSLKKYDSESYFNNLLEFYAG